MIPYPAPPSLSPPLSLSLSFTRLFPSFQTAPPLSLSLSLSLSLPSLSPSVHNCSLCLPAFLSIYLSLHPIFSPSELRSHRSFCLPACSSIRTSIPPSHLNLAPALSTLPESRPVSSAEGANDNQPGRRGERRELRGESREERGERREERGER